MTPKRLHDEHDYGVVVFSLDHQPYFPRINELLYAGNGYDFVSDEDIDHEHMLMVMELNNDNRAKVMAWAMTIDVITRRMKYWHNRDSM